MRVSVAWEAWEHKEGKRPITPGGKALVRYSRRRCSFVTRCTIIKSVRPAKFGGPRLSEPQHAGTEQRFLFGRTLNLSHALRLGQPRSLEFAHFPGSLSCSGSTLCRKLGRKLY